MKFDLAREIVQSLEEATDWPRSRTLNSVGVMLAGRFRTNDFPFGEFRGFWLVVLYLPVIPLGIYFLPDANLPFTMPSLCRIPIGRFFRFFGLRGLRLLGFAAVEGIIYLAAAAFVVSMVVGIMQVIRRH